MRSPRVVEDGKREPAAAKAGPLPGFFRTRHPGEPRRHHPELSGPCREGVPTFR